MLNDVLDRHIPLKSKRVYRTNQPVWMTKEIPHSMTNKKSAEFEFAHDLRMQKVKPQIFLEKQREVFFVKKSTRAKETRKVSGKL